MTKINQISPPTVFLALRSEGSSLPQSLLLISKLCRYIFTFTSQENRFSFELYLTIILIISPRVPFPPKGNFCCKSAKVIYHRPAFSPGLSTHIDFATRLSNYLHKSANSPTNNVTNRSKKIPWSSKEVVCLYFPKAI